MAKEERIGNTRKKLWQEGDESRKTKGTMILPLTQTDTDKWLRWKL